MKLYNQIKLSEAEQDKFVFSHLMAMTGEKLHSKHDIAYELGARDKRIVELEKERDEANCHAYYILETCKVFSPTKFQAHNLEQHAIALNEYAYSNKPLTKRGLNLESIALNNKASSLKEPKT